MFFFFGITCCHIADYCQACIIQLVSRYMYYTFWKLLLKRWYRFPSCAVDWAGQQRWLSTEPSRSTVIFKIINLAYDEILVGSRFARHRNIRQCSGQGGITPLVTSGQLDTIIYAWRHCLHILTVFLYCIVFTIGSTLSKWLMNVAISA